MRTTFVIPSLICLIFAVSINAQTSKTKKTKPKPTPTPVKTIPMPIGTPEVVATANDGTELIAVPQSTPETAPTQEQIVAKIKELSRRLSTIEKTQSNEFDEKQKRLLMALDILTKAEARADSMRKQLLDMTERENTAKIRLAQLEIDLRPEMVERAVATTGSLRPEELREQRRRTLTAERDSLSSLVRDISAARLDITQNLDKADSLVRRLREKFDTDVEVLMKVL